MKDFFAGLRNKISEEKENLEKTEQSADNLQKLAPEEKYQRRKTYWYFHSSSCYDQPLLLARVEIY
jgi:hypothetical protein